MICSCTAWRCGWAWALVLKESSHSRRQSIPVEPLVEFVPQHGLARSSHESGALHSGSPPPCFASRSLALGGSPVSGVGVGRRLQGRCHGDGDCPEGRISYHRKHPRCEARVVLSFSAQRPACGPEPSVGGAKPAILAGLHAKHLQSGVQKGGAQLFGQEGQRTRNRGNWRAATMGLRH